MLFINNNALCSFCLCELCVCNLFYKLYIRKQLLILFFLFIQLKQIVKNNFHEIFLSKLMCFFLLLYMIFMFFVCILFIWLEVWIMWILCFISCYQLSQQSMSLLHFQQLWVVMMTLVCWSDHLLRVVTNWHETLNEFSSQMTVQVCMHKDSFFVWSLIILWTFSWISSQIVASSDFVYSNKLYFLAWNHMQIFIFCSHDILVMSECRAFHFVASQSTCSFNQQNCSHQFVEVVLS